MNPKPRAWRTQSALLAALFLALAFGASSVLAQDRDQTTDPAADSAQVDRDAAGLPGSLREWIHELPPEQRRPAVERLRHMPEQRRQVFIRRWNRMSEHEREAFGARLQERETRRMRGIRRDLERGHRPGVREHFQRMTPSERRRFRSQMDRWRDMPPPERAVMRQRLERFHRLTPADQEAVVERSFPDASPSERAKKLEQLRAAARARPHRRQPAQR